MNPKILHVSQLEFKPFPMPLPESVKDRYEGSMTADIGRRLGAQKLGYNVTLVPPGKRAFQFHNHRVNEEAFFVMEGEGEIRIGSDTYPVKAGDFIACAAGGPETAHQIVNTSDHDLKYLAISTRLSPEIADYPDSGKFGILAEFQDAEGKPAQFRFLGKADQSLGYFDGE